MNNLCTELWKYTSTQEGQTLIPANVCISLSELVYVWDIKLHFYIVRYIVLQLSIYCINGPLNKLNKPLPFWQVSYILLHILLHPLHSGNAGVSYLILFNHMLANGKPLTWLYDDIFHVMWIDNYISTGVHCQSTFVGVTFSSKS